MAGNRYLLDTNVIFNGDKRVKNFLLETNNVKVPAIVIGELYFGVYLSSDKNKNIEQINTFLNFYPVLNVDIDTSEYYGQIKSSLKEKGRLIPENDIWIAAICKQHNRILLSNDKHFNEIEGIQIQSINL